MKAFAPSLFHKLLIIDYLNCHNIKPSIWWDEKNSPKEKNELLRELIENNKINYDINILYKYSILIPLKDCLLLVIYKDNKRELHIIEKEV